LRIMSKYRTFIESGRGLIGRTLSAMGVLLLARPFGLAIYCSLDVRIYRNFGVGAVYILDVGEGRFPSVCNDAISAHRKGEQVSSRPVSDVDKNKPSTITRALAAPFRGIQIVLGSRALIKLSLIPWMVGFVAYVLAMFAAYWFHHDVVGLLVGDQIDGWLQSVLYGLAWLGAALVMFFLGLLFSVIVVLIVSGPFLSAIAEKTLRDLGAHLEEPSNSGISATLLGGAKSAGQEVMKLVWLVPLSIASVSLGFVPLLSPIAFLLASWLLAYEFVDLSLELAGLSAAGRFKFAIRRFATVSLFGVVLLLVWPFVGMVIAPFATAGASWLLSKEEIFLSSNKSRR